MFFPPSLKNEKKLIGDPYQTVQNVNYNQLIQINCYNQSKADFSTTTQLLWSPAWATFIQCQKHMMAQCLQEQQPHQVFPVRKRSGEGVTTCACHLWVSFQALQELQADTLKQHLNPVSHSLLQSQPCGPRKG